MSMDANQLLAALQLEDGSEPSSATEATCDFFKHGIIISGHFFKKSSTPNTIQHEHGVEEHPLQVLTAPGILLLLTITLPKVEYLSATQALQMYIELTEAGAKERAEYADNRNAGP